MMVDHIRRDRTDIEQLILEAANVEAEKSVYQSWQLPYIGQFKHRPTETKKEVWYHLTDLQRYLSQATGERVAYLRMGKSVMVGNVGQLGLKGVCIISGGHSDPDNPVSEEVPEYPASFSHGSTLASARVMLDIDTAGTLAMYSRNDKEGCIDGEQLVGDLGISLYASYDPVRRAAQLEARLPFYKHFPSTLIIGNPAVGACLEQLEVYKPTAP